MGYYINILRQGQMYELEGQKLQFIERIDGRYYFHICQMDYNELKCLPTGEITSFTIQEINFIRRVNDEQKSVGLRRIGRERVFPRY
jgi:hypothetical protein